MLSQPELDAADLQIPYSLRDYLQEHWPSAEQLADTLERQGASFPDPIYQKRYEELVDVVTSHLGAFIPMNAPPHPEFYVLAVKRAGERYRADQDVSNACGPWTGITQGLYRFVSLVVLERSAQDKEWGGPKHDDQHSPLQWKDFLLKQINEFARTLAVPELKTRLIKIAALSLAAWQSLDRLEQRRKSQE